MLLNAIIEKDGNGYFAFVPALKGCFSQGCRYEEALANIKEATELYLESLGQDEISIMQNTVSVIAPIEIVLQPHG